GRRPRCGGHGVRARRGDAGRRDRVERGDETYVIEPSVSGPATSRSFPEIAPLRSKTGRGDLLFQPVAKELCRPAWPAIGCDEPVGVLRRAPAPKRLDDAAVGECVRGQGLEGQEDAAARDRGVEAERRVREHGPRREAAWIDLPGEK